MNVYVRYFAATREACGRGEETLDLKDGTTVSALLGLLRRRHTNLAHVLGGVRVAVNERFATEDEVVPPNAVVALIPPVSGG